MVSLAISETPAPDMAALTRGLSEKAVKFCELRASGLSLHRAVTLAGFEAKDKRNATSIGWSLSQDPRAVALMEHFARNLVRAAAPRAIKVLDSIMTDTELKPSDRTRAAGKLLDKVVPTLLHHEAEGHIQHQHEHTVRQAPTLDDLRREAGLIPPLPAPIDAEFEVIAPTSAADADEWSV
jgi:hypothetical protein